MSFCFNLQFILKIKSTDLLTYLALFLAYIAYCWSVNRDFRSWESLFNSLKVDLDNQSEWLKNEYFEDTYKDKTSFTPRKIIFPLSFESLPEIIRRGVAEFSWISKEFIKHLSLFNERVVAFNALLDQVRQSAAADPIKSEKLGDLLNDLGLDKESMEFDKFKKSIQESKMDNELLYLAENFRRLNRNIHVKLISNKSEDDKLHYLYSKIREELDIILRDFKTKRPWFIRFEWWLVILSIPLFILLENLH